VEIDNETLTEQVKHFQSRIANLEEQLDEARSQAETDSDAWQVKYNKAREAETNVHNDLERAKDETKAHEAEVESHKSRITELQGAMKENQTMLEAARAEIESMRAEASAASAAKLATNASETTIAELQDKLKDASAKSTELEGKVTSLEEEIATVGQKEGIHLLTFFSFVPKSLSPMRPPMVMVQAHRAPFPSLTVAVADPTVPWRRLKSRSSATTTLSTR
jgi:predicted RNase H-like nuclease (RuvC/YqgF family)